MRNEDHRHLSMKAYQSYANKAIKIETFSLVQLGSKEHLPPRDNGNLVYVLRIGANANKHPSLSSIPNRDDPLGVLYIGGHESGKNTQRYNALLKSCRRSEADYALHGYAANDPRHGHPVACNLTTSLLAAGFRISDCIVDFLDGGNEFNELEFMIGYQERYHQRPPWNATRGGASAYVVNSVQVQEASPPLSA